MVVAVITELFGLVNKLSSKGALEGRGMEVVCPSDGRIGTRKIIARLIVSNSGSDVLHSEIFLLSIVSINLNYEFISCLQRFQLCKLVVYLQNRDGFVVSTLVLQNQGVKS
jgi:hypothetical protein